MRQKSGKGGLKQDPGTPTMQCIIYFLRPYGVMWVLVLWTSVRHCDQIERPCSRVVSHLDYKMTEAAVTLCSGMMRIEDNGVSTRSQSV